MWSSHKCYLPPANEPHTTRSNHIQTIHSTGGQVLDEVPVSGYWLRRSSLIGAC